MSAVSVLFLLSGFTGLVYEVLWSKYLALSFGGTGLAQTLVLAAFLGGLAAGNALLGPRADRSASPLRLYAWLELGIALAGFASPLVMGSRWGLAVAAVSSALMGGTLPALSRWSVRDLGSMAPAVSRLYSLNSFGAAAGSLAAGFLLIPGLGLDLACLCAAGLNLAVACAAFRLGGTEPALALGATSRTGGSPELGTVGAPLASVCLVALAMGLVSLALEICWTRLLSIVLGSSAHSFAVMLAAFVAGIGAGGWLVAAKRLPPWPSSRLLGLALLAAGAALLLTLPAYDKLPYLFQNLANRIPRTQAMFPVYETAKLLFCLALMLPVTAFLGMTLPLACRAATGSLSEVGTGVGRICALNAAGNVLGALGAGLWLMPALGLERLLSAATVVELGAGCLLLCLDPGASRRLKGAGLGLCAAAFAVLALLPRWDWVPLSFVAARLQMPPMLTPSDFRAGLAGFRLVSREDDREATVAVLSDQDDQKSLVINGKADASTSSKDQRTQLLLAQLPLLLRPGAEEVLVVGLGGGFTAGSALAHPLRRLDVVEISRAVVEAGGYFAPTNGRVLEQPRTSLHVEDAKTFLARPGRGYDVIISEPSNPWIAGIGNLFSAEFYAAARARLRPGGIMAQWFHLYEMDDDTLRLVLRTFASAFPQVSVWRTYARDVILLGSDRPLEADPAALEASFGRPEVRAELARVGISRPATLLNLQCAGDAVARSWAGQGPVNTDRFPRLEYTAPKALFLRLTSLLPLKGSGFFDDPRPPGLLLPLYLAARGRGLSGEEFAELVSYERQGGGVFVRTLTEAWLAAWPRDPRALTALAEARLAAGEPAAALELLRPRVGKGDIPAMELAAQAELALADPKGAGPAAERARALLERLLGLESRGADGMLARYRLAQLAQRRGDYSAAVAQMMAAAQKARPGSTPSRDAIWVETAVLALGHDDASTMLYCLDRALEANPSNAAAQELIGVLKESRQGP